MVSVIFSVRRSREGFKSQTVEDNRPALNVGLIVPFSNFLKKQYEKSVGAAVSGIKKKKFSWSYIYNLDEYTIHTEMMSINPSPTGERDGPRIVLSRLLLNVCFLKL